MKYCTQCGTKLEDSAVFCSSCGAKQQDSAGEPKKESQETIFGAFTGAVNKLTGGKNEAVHPPMRKLFGQILKKHTQEEAEMIFACGTPTTTPKLTTAEATWPQPWLWSRVLVGLGLAFFMMLLCCELFNNINALPGTIVLGSFMVPVGILVFFFELNTPKNISFYNVLKIFLVGGCGSLLLTLTLFSLTKDTGKAYLEAIITGVVEEVAKAGIVAYFILREKDAKHTVNGLLVGAAVGAGFAAFESAGYALRFYLNADFGRMLDVILLRAYLAPGGHVVWAAMAGYAMMLVKGDGAMSVQVFRKKAFWKIFWIPIAMHAIWDMPILASVETPVVQIALCVASWIVIFVLISNCLTQLAEKVSKAASEEAAQSLPESEPAE